MSVPQNELHRVVPTAIIVKDGKYLVLRRSLNQKVLPGKWGVPGGGLSMEDYRKEPPTHSKDNISLDQWYFAIEKALEREVREETGLEIEDIKYVCDLVFIRPDGVPVVVLSYWAKWKSGEVVLNEENVEYKWTTLAELKNIDLIDGIYEEIKMVDELFAA